jgi:hypothetical protein
MPLIGDLTRPENACELQQRRRIAARIAQAGGCALCVHRDPTVMVWGRSVCSTTAARAYPLCLKDGRAPAFELDHEQLKGTP